ncbi:hypothetical protein [Variovorax sp. GT1P44]|uniref:hypothetical protein n=1 Tax=Variovorax sp. GT1P44 TaxID=3443742 RepID=UPI003F485002
MTPPTPDIHATLRKVKRYQMSQWVGHLTPAEAKSLVQAGATANPHDLAWMQSGLQAGNDAARWFYFSAKPALHAMLRALPS